MGPEYGELPFLIVHGGLVWKIVLAAVAGGALVAHLGWRARQARRRARAMVAAARAAQTAALAEGKAVLCGTVVGGGATTLHFEDALRPGRPPAARHERASALALACDGERVELHGPIAVAYGSHAATAWRRPPPATPAPLVEAASALADRRQLRLASVADGDQVVAAGRLARRASSAEAGYREAGGGWALSGGDGPIALVATRPAAGRPLLRPVAPVLCVVALAAATVYGGLRLWGHLALERAGNVELAEGAPVVLGRLDAFAVAAAMPRTRDRALDVLTARLAWHRWRDEAAVGRLLALAELRGGGCLRVAELQRRHGLHDDALTTARRCGDRVGEWNALVSLGRYGEALDLPDFERDYPSREVQVAIVAGRWDRAAAAADRVVAEAEAELGRAYKDDLRPLRLRDERRSRCLAELFRFHSGDAAAADRIAALSTTEMAEACVLAFAETLPAGERGGWLREATAPWVAAPRDDYGMSKARSHAVALLWAEGAGGAGHRWTTYDAIQVLIRGDWMHKGWLAPWAAAARPDPTSVPPDELAAIRAYEAAIAVYRDDFDAARIAARQAAATGTRVGTELLAAVELRTDTIDVPAVETRERTRPTEIRRGATVDDSAGSWVYPDACRPHYLDGLRRAQAGDGARLAQVLRTCRVHRFDLILAVLPRVTRGSDQLADAIAWYHYDQWFESWLPFDLVDHAAMRRDLLRLAGRETDAARWHAIVERNLAVFAERDRLVALYLWNDF